MILVDSIFTDWSGMQSPLALISRSTAVVRDSIFRNVNLAVELADVSGGSSVRFQNTTLVDVELRRDAIVGTSSNDNKAQSPCLLVYGEDYYQEDEEDFDVHACYVPPEERGPAGGQYVIREGLMSDCLFLLSREVPPGCPASSAEARRRMLAGESAHFIDERSGPSPHGVCTKDLDHVPVQSIPAEGCLESDLAEKLAWEGPLYDAGNATEQPAPSEDFEGHPEQLGVGQCCLETWLAAERQV